MLSFVRCNLNLYLAILTQYFMRTLWVCSPSSSNNTVQLEYLDVRVLRRGVGEIRVVMRRAPACWQVWRGMQYRRSQWMTNHSTPQLSRMDLANHCATFPGLSTSNRQLKRIFSQAPCVIWHSANLNLSVRNQIINRLNKNKTKLVAWVHERTILTERPLLVGEVSANFCG
jgi:hypothetical protein